jgi:hypothetical protein
MEKTPNPSEEKSLVLYQESLVLATKLYDEYKDDLAKAQMDNFGRANMSEYINQIPKEVAEKFYAHGITRGTQTTNLAVFMNILANDSIKGDYGALIGGQFGAWTRSDLLILSHYDRHLGVSGDGDSRLKKNEIGWVADIGAYVISNKYYPVLDELKKLYPGKNIIRADEIPQFVSQEVGLS